METGELKQGLERVATSNAIHAALAVGMLWFAFEVVAEATTVVGRAHFEGEVLTATEPLWVPIVFAWASLLWVGLVVWLLRTTLPEVTGEGWTKLKRHLWVEWLTQALRWVVALQLVGLGFTLGIAWTRWAGLAFGFEAAVYGPGSDWVVFVPIAVGAVLVGVRTAVAFRRGRAST